MANFTAQWVYANGVTTVGQTSDPNVTLGAWTPATTYLTNSYPNNPPYFYTGVLSSYAISTEDVGASISMTMQRTDGLAWAPTEISFNINTDDISNGKHSVRITAPNSVVTNVATKVSSSAGLKTYTVPALTEQTGVWTIRIYLMAGKLYRQHIGGFTVAGATPAPVSVPVNVTAPAMTMNLTAPGGQSLIVNNDTKATAPVMTMSVSAPSASVRIPVSSVAPAMSISLSAVAPTINVPLTLSPTADAASGTTTGGTGESVTFGNSSFQGNLFFKFPDATIPAGQQVVSATLELTRTGTVPASTSYTVRQMDRTLVESDNNSFGYAATVLHSGNIPSGSAGEKVQIDVTSAYTSGSPYGFALVYVSGSASSFAMRENTTVAYRPRLTVQLADIPQVPAISTVVGPMSASVAMPQHRSGVSTTVTVSDAGSVNIEALDATASAQRNIRAVSPAMTLTLQMPGGESRNPDQYIKAGAMEAWIFAPNAQQYISVPSVNTAPPMEVSLAGTSDTNISLKTDRRVFVTTPMKMNMNMVGIYQREADRYLNYVPLTADRDDIWYQMEETGGTVAIDAMTGLEGATVIDKLDGTYVGGPTFGAEGPKLRKAVHFDGVDDHVKFPAYLGVFTNSDMTYEFSLRTTQENGVVLGGGGAYKTQTMGTQGGAYNGGDIRLVNGRLTLRAGSIDYAINKYVADGEWHHIVISMPHSTNNNADFAMSTGRQHFVVVDGQTVWGRYTVGYNTMTFLPLSAMARVNSAGQAVEALAGEMRDLIVRINYATSQNTARKLYYEWSESLVINPEPMTASVNMPKPHSAKGNVKRMIVLYGLPYKLYRQQRSAGYFRDGWGTYYSIFAGFFIPTNAGESQGGTGAVTNEFQAQYGSPQIATNITPMVYLAPKPFMLQGYMCYPVAVATTPGSSGALDAAGLVKDGLRDPITGQLIDDATGLNRFIDITKDLNEPITDYDAITAVNYPAIQPIENNVTANAVEDFEQHNLGLNKDEWAQARDRLRDSIMEASYLGVNLWVSEPHMAEHLGFIKAWDKHETGARVEFFGAGNIDSTGYTNTAAQAIDEAHLTGVASDDAGVAAPGIGQYNYTWQANAKRQIVATEPGLTDIPSFEYGDRVSYQAADMWRPHAQYTAYDLQDKSNGLLIGDKIGMDMWEQNDNTGNYPSFDNFSVGVPRKYIVSARPQGIAGKVISKEMDSYYGPYGVVRVNPWRANVYTIVAEKGTVVRGRPIAGRAFVELMDTMTTVPALPSDRDKSAWKGNTGHGVTSWSFDSRRYRELVATWTTQRVVSVKGGGAVSLNEQVSKMEVENPQFIYHPHVSMNARGLRWLQLSDSLPAGDAKAYVPAIELDVAGTGVEVENTRNTVVSVTGHMRLDAELRGAANYSDGDVKEKALPMVLNLEMRGTGKHIKVSNAMELSLSTLDARVVGDGDKIYVYMDEATEITLFMKED